MRIQGQTKEDREIRLLGIKTKKQGQALTLPRGRAMERTISRVARVRAAGRLVPGGDVTPPLKEKRNRPPSKVFIRKRAEIVIAYGSTSEERKEKKRKEKKRK